jgi:radical SAM protein with 4Fe4S-binding SPASM domain
MKDLPMKVKTKKILNYITRAGLMSPKIITIMITNQCNLSCSHCLTESHFNETANPISTGAIKRLIEESTHLGVEEICLTGGEPLMHPEWFKILSFACRHNRLKRVRLQTNGTLLTEFDIKLLCSIDSKKLMIQVSLEGSIKETNDKVRGAGNFEQVIQGLKLLAEAGLGQQVIIAFTEMQHNFAELPNLFQLIERLGIGSIVSGTLIQNGRALRTNKMEPPTQFQYSELLNHYHSDRKFKELYQKFGNIAALEWFKGKSHPATVGCKCIEKPYIDVAGMMYPCLLMPIEKLAVKNVYHRPLNNVLYEGLSLWAELSDLYNRRSVELEECNNCSGRQHCAGGCMGRAYATTGDFMNVEDRCALRKEVYSWKSKIK